MAQKECKKCGFKKEVRKNVNICPATVVRGEHLVICGEPLTLVKDDSNKKSQKRHHSRDGHLNRSTKQHIKNH